jgi:hypothetical protein
MQPGYFWNRGFSQYLEMWTHAVKAAKGARGNVAVVGPSISNFDLRFLMQFLDNANETQTFPDVLSWHEFSSDGSDIPANVQAARTLLATYGVEHKTRISINEMVPMNSNFDPSIHIFYFANLERAAVDSACHSCWAEDCPIGGAPPCFNCAQADAAGVHGGQSLDGLLTVDSASPRSVWWAYKAYAALNGTLLQTNASAGAGRAGGIDGLASLSEDGRMLSAVVGKMSGGSSGATGRVIFRGVPIAVLNAGGGTAIAAVASIPNTGKLAASAPTVRAGVVTVLPASTVSAAGAVESTATAAATVQVDFNLGQSEVALIVVGKEASVAVAHFTKAP